MSRNIVWSSLVLIALSITAAGVPSAAQDAPSVAEAAKRARVQKQESAKSAKVITNDTIPGAPLPDSASTPATPTNEAAAAPTPGSAPAGTAANTKQSAAEAAEDEQKKKAEIESLEKQIRELQHNIDIQKHEITLDESTYYSNPNRPRDESEKDRIDREKLDLEIMLANIEDLRAQLEALGVVIPPKPPKPPESITSNAPPQS
jgi:predicted RNase H-like nuclease (RuvC/YqgF family)